MFDHKPVHLIFRRDNPHKKQTINDMILKDIDLENVVRVAVLETYINHIEPSATISDLDIERYCIIIGRSLSDQKLLTNCKINLASNGHNENVMNRCTVLREQINHSLESLPTLEFFENCNLSCEKDTFLEILIMAVKNSSLSHQHNFFKIKNAKRVSLEKKLLSCAKTLMQIVGKFLERKGNLTISLNLTYGKKLSK